MLDWFTRNSEVLQIVLDGLMVAIWVVYLQIFLVSFRRQRRADLLINLGSGPGRGSRCLVSNLGLEPVYLLDVLVELATGDGVHEAAITERAEVDGARLQSPSAGTTQGPLASGAFIDIGSLDDLLERALPQLGGVDPGAIEGFTITALAHTAATSEIVGARRSFRVSGQGEATRITPTRIAATQIRSWWGRRQLRRKLQRRLSGR